MLLKSIRIKRGCASRFVPKPLPTLWARDAVLEPVGSNSVSSHSPRLQRPELADAYGSLYGVDMKLAEIEQEALALPDRARASLAAKLLDTLPPPGTDVSDEEVEERERELDSGQVAAISHEEFVRGVQQQRVR